MLKHGAHVFYELGEGDSSVDIDVDFDFWKEDLFDNLKKMNLKFEISGVPVTHD